MAVKKDIRTVKSKRYNKNVQKETWQCEGSYVDILGKPQRYHKRGFQSEYDAKQWERTFLIQAKKDNTQADITFNDLYLIYLKNREKVVKLKTYTDIQYLCNRMLLPFWKDIKVNKINLPIIESWQNNLLSKTYFKNGIDNFYTNEYLSKTQIQLKSIFRYGIKTGYVTNLQLISFDNVKHIGQHKTEMLFWHPDEFLRFIDVVNDITFKALFNVLYWCGLRIGESLALTWNDVNLTTSTIKVSKTYNNNQHLITTPKTYNSYRDVIMPERCIKSIIALYEYSQKLDGFSNDKYLFGYTQPFDDNFVRRHKNEWCRIANVKQIRIHDLRHSHVSLLINQGFSSFDIAKRLGHTVEMVNNHYGHWFDNSQQKMVDKLNRL